MNLKTFRSFLDLLFESNAVNFTQFGKKKAYKTLNSANYAAEIGKVQQWMYSKKVQAGEHICTLFENSIEWNVCDEAIMAFGAIHVSLSPATHCEKINAILDQCQIKHVIVGNSLIRELLSTKLDAVTLVTYQELLQESEETIEEQKNKLPIKGNSLASLFFTSGTTSSTKAVYHSHEAILGNALETAQFYDFPKNSTALSILPIHYAFERMYNYVYQFSGLNIVYANSSKSLIENILTVQPAVFCIVPNLLEQLISESNTQLAEFVNYVKVKKPLIVCSGAAIPEKLYDQIEELGIAIYEMYGSTETLIIAANSKKEHQKRTSGKLVFPNRVNITDSNQLMVNLAKSYYHPSFSAKENIKNSWFNTKDLVSLDDGFLIIKGRDDETFKSKAGLFQNALEIESHFKQSSIIQNALIFYDKGLGICGVFGLGKEESPSSLAKLIQSYNNKQEESKKISHFTTTDTWSPESGELTMSYKVKRNFILQKYKNQLIEVN